MVNFLKTFRREVVYTVLLFTIWEMGQLPEVFGIGWMTIFFGLLGGLVITTWVITSYFLYANRKVSRFSEVIIKIQLKKRFFLYIGMPIMYYIVMSAYLFFNNSVLLKQLFILFSTGTLFVMFVHIKTSYLNIYAVSKYTRVIFNFVDIFLFYLSLSVLLFILTDPAMKLLIVASLGLTLLSHQLILHKQESMESILILAVSLLFLVMASYLFIGFSIYTYPLAMTILFYLIVAIWNVRFEGRVSFSDYLPPVMFSLMAFIVLMSFR